MAGPTICLVGNPNCGKTTLFNSLTGARQQVGNWPGVTVEKKTGSYAHGGRDVTVVDLPGVYSMAVVSAASIDERVARDFILGGDADIVVNIVDASNLERNLYLTAQLIEMRRPMVVALNMMDVASARRLRIDVAALAAELGCPVVPMVAHRGEGVALLKAAVDTVLAAGHGPAVELGYAQDIEASLVELVPLVTPAAGKRRLNPRWLALKLLEGDDGAHTLLGDDAEAVLADCQARIARRCGEDADILVADSRYGFANSVMHAAVCRTGVVAVTRTDSIDRVVLHRLLGIPIFLAVMYALFLFTIHVGGAFIDFFDILGGAFFVDGTRALLAGVGSPAWLTAVLADGVGGGLQTVATFIPVIACLYLFLSFLEDCGYMARAAFVMDRLMRAVGLPGKSFIPLIVGFGCNVPAIMATRTLENQRDRILTVMMAPFMSCGARLPVYALFAAAFFPENGGRLVFLLYLIGIAFAVITGLALRHTLLQGEASPFVMELPPYHLPTLKAVVLHTWDRLKGFVLRAGRVIVAVVVVLNMLGSLGTDGSFGHRDTDQSLLAVLAQRLTPVFEPMGITRDNWPATVGLISGIFAKEAVVGTLNSLYGAADAGTAAEGAFDPLAAVAAAAASVVDNLGVFAAAVSDPLGFGIANDATPVVSAERQGVSLGTFGAMALRFDGPVGAFAYLLAVLLYMPCVAALAAIYRETGLARAAFATLWTSGLAYGAGVIAYQAGTFARSPGTAALWIGGVLAAFALAIAILRAIGGPRRWAAGAAPAE